MPIETTLARPSGKQIRRARIIREAQKMISEHGYDALSLRKLAQAADVTVPTIYNLIGAKDQILIELFRSWIAKIESALDMIEEDRPLDRAESIITEAIVLIGQDEVFFRAAHIAIYRLIEMDPTRTSLDQFDRKAIDMQTGAALQA